MKNQDVPFSDLRAVFINCSLKKKKTESHTQRLMDKAIFIMEKEGVSVEKIYANEHKIAFGMIKDGAENNDQDEWPSIQAKIENADILVMGTPIWLGTKSSIASLVIERLYAYSSDQNQKGQYVYYGKVGGCVVTGNEDGVKHCAMDILFALQHIGYTIPPQADCGWIGPVGPGPSYGDTMWEGKKIKDGKSPVGYDCEFTNKNTTYMAWNLMHMAHLLKQNGGIEAKGTTSDSWKNVSNAKDSK